MKYCGIDLHSNNSVVAVIDDDDCVVAQKRLANELTKIVGFLAPWKEELIGVVVESTYNWYWLVDGLQDAGFRVHLANTGAIKQYDGLKHSGDETDAYHLAHLLRLGILRTGTILPKEQRALRDLARKRMQLTRSHTTHILAAENIMARQLGARMSSRQATDYVITRRDAAPRRSRHGIGDDHFGSVVTGGCAVSFRRLRTSRYMGRCVPTRDIPLEVSVCLPRRCRRGARGAAEIFAAKKLRARVCVADHRDLNTVMAVT